MDRGAVKAGPAREGHVGNHLEGGGDHLGEHIGPPAQTGGNAGGRAFGGMGHHRGEGGYIAVGEDRGGCAALPHPMLAFRDKQAFADRRAEDQFGHQRFGVIIHPVAQDMAQRLWLHHHVPALACCAGQDRCMGGGFGDQFQHIAPRGFERAQDTKRRAVQRDADGMRHGALLYR